MQNINKQQLIKLPGCYHELLVIFRFEKCEIKNVTDHRNVQGLDPQDEGNSDNLQQMSAATTNDARIQNKNDSCVETPCSSASSSVYHHVNNNAASSIFSSKPLPSKNFHLE